jgi:hypothetical protein
MKILKEFKTTDFEGHYDFIVKKTDKIRTREIFTIIPIYHKKVFSWFQYVKIEERLYIVQKQECGDIGPYWAKPYEDWRIKKILKNK